jgi:hypothetical protein
MAKINYYVAVFIDVLGQGEKLSGIKHLPQDDEEKEAFMKLIQETVGAVQTLHKRFDDFFNGFQKISPDIEQWLASTSEDMRATFLKSRELNLKYLNFSDTVVVYFTLDKLNTPAPMRVIHSALSACASTFLVMMSSGIPLRGAINIGVGTDIETSGLYGPIIQNLHYLESKVAKYPRIVVGDELMEMISVFENDTSDENVFKKIDNVSIKLIKELIKIDADGKSIVHYLSKTISDTLGDKRNNLFKDYEKFVNEQYMVHCSDEKLGKRYRQLKKYMRQNKANWQ